jgi:DNA (cytosine-5)-methyltransferase 1
MYPEFSIKVTLPANSKFRVASVFSGAGGLDLGFALPPTFQTVFHLDNNSTAIRTLRENKEDWFDTEATIVDRDIVEFVTELQEGTAEGNLDVDPDILVGGPPCQPFSAAARRTGGTNGTESEEGRLFLAYCDLLKEWEPSAFLFENVYGITSNDEDWEPIKQAFENAGYKVKPKTLDTADYGVPQHRIRTFIVGVRKESNHEYHFPKPTHGPESDGGPTLNTAGDALSGLTVDVSGDKYSMNSKYADLLPEVPPGLNYSFFTEKLGHPNPRFAWRSRFSDFLYKAIPGEPVRTLKAQPGGANGPFHWDNRRFTESELKRLQSFPDDYQLAGSYSKVVRQIGNSVPPRMACVLARSMAAQLFDWIPEMEWESPFLPYQTLSEEAVPEELSDDAELNFRSRKRTPLKMRAQRAQKRLGDRAEVDEEVDPERITPREYEFDLGNIIELLEGGSFYEELRERQYLVESRVTDGTLSVNIVGGNDIGGGTIELKLVSDEGYLLPAIEAAEIEVVAESVGVPDLFSIWAVLIEDIRARTDYGQLMSVVGHYSCAPSNFSAQISFKGISASPLRQAAEFFSSEEHCNRYFTISEIANSTGIPRSALANTLERLRELRYDIRTPSTHSNIQNSESGAPEVLCTYPFPNLVSASPFDIEAELTEIRNHIQKDALTSKVNHD